MALAVLDQCSDVESNHWSSTANATSRVRIGGRLSKLFSRLLQDGAAGGTDEHFWVPLVVPDQGLDSFDYLAKARRRSPRSVLESSGGLRVVWPLVHPVGSDGRWTIANRPTFRRVADDRVLVDGGDSGLNNLHGPEIPIRISAFLPESKTVDTGPLADG